MSNVKTKRIGAGEYEFHTRGGVFFANACEYERGLWWLTYPDGLREDCYSLRECKYYAEAFEESIIKAIDIRMEKDESNLL
jgi:hypothetical protein